MEESPARPLWVDLVFSVIQKRKHALWLIGASVVFSVYCFPWPKFIVEDHPLVGLLLADDWSWLALMIPVLVWYLLALRWMDKASAWAE
jgi:hypothetical protein